MYNDVSLHSLLRMHPQAIAQVSGSNAYPTIHGKIFFYQTKQGVLVAARIWGLPTPTEDCENPIFALHIHNGSNCTGNGEDPFANALTHYNPQQCPHPYHAGDLPPLFGNDGYALSAVLTNRFTVKEVIGRTIIIHANPDDFTTQPSGNSGTKIACGEIQAVQ